MAASTHATGKESAHTIPESELRAMVAQINKRLANDSDVADHLPLDPPNMVHWIAWVDIFVCFHPVVSFSFSPLCTPNVHIDNAPTSPLYFYLIYLYVIPSSPTLLLTVFF